YPAVHQLIGRIAARTGISFTAHMLRHSHATDMVRRGVPIAVVARLLTHRSSTTTSQVYVHLGAADIREALTRAGVWHEEEAGWATRRRRARAGSGSKSSPGRRRPSTANGPRTTGRPGAWASPPGAGAPRPALTGSASRGCATRSSAGPGSAWPLDAHSPPSARGHWRSPGSPGSSPP